MVRPILLLVSAQILFRYLARAGAWKRLHELHRAGTFVARNLLPAVGDDLLRARRATGLQRHYGFNRLAPAFIGNAYDRGLAHRGMLVEGILDLGRVNHLAAAQDDILLSVDDVEVPLALYRCQIAGVNPAVAERLGGGLRQPPVSRRDTARSGDDLAHGLAVRGDVPSLFIDNSKRHAERGAPGHGAVAHLFLRRKAAQLFLEQREGQIRAGLGEAVSLDVLAAKS